MLRNDNNLTSISSTLFLSKQFYKNKLRTTPASSDKKTTNAENLNSRTKKYCNKVLSYAEANKGTVITGHYYHSGFDHVAAVDEANNPLV